MMLRDQENVFLFEFGLIMPAVLKCLFYIIYKDVVYPPGESYPYLLNFAPINDFLDVYNAEYPSQTQNT